MTASRERPDASVDRQEAQAVGGVAAGEVSEFVADDGGEFVEAQQRQVGQRHVEGAARQRTAPGLQHLGAGADEEASGQTHHDGLGPQGAEPVREPVDEAPQARRIGGRDRTAEDRKRVGFEGGECAPQARQRDARGVKAPEDGDAGEEQHLDLSDSDARLEKRGGLEADHADEGHRAEDDLDAEQHRQQPSHECEAAHQHLAGRAAEPAEHSPGEQDEAGQACRQTRRPRHDGR